MWNRTTTRAPSRWPACLGTIAFCVALLLSLAGCSGTGEMVLAGTEDDALEVLTAALDAWKAGQEPDELQNESPPIFVRDADWMEGRSLKAFEAREAPQEHGGEWKVFATLTLTGGDRADEQKLVAYSVTTETKVVVITRSDNID